MRWWQPSRPEILAPVTSGKRSERHRRVRRAIRRRAHFRDLTFQPFGKDREAYNTADLALVGSHTKRRVAFEMFDRMKSFLLGNRDILDGDVVL